MLTPQLEKRRAPRGRCPCVRVRSVIIAMHSLASEIPLSRRTEPATIIPDLHPYTIQRPHAINSSTSSALTLTSRAMTLPSTPLSFGKGKSVLIYGASIAGPSIAWWLNRYGFETTIVERWHELRGGGQNIDVRGVGVIFYSLKCLEHPP